MPRRQTRSLRDQYGDDVCYDLRARQHDLSLYHAGILGWAPDMYSRDQPRLGVYYNQAPIDLVDLATISSEHRSSED